MLTVIESEAFIYIRSKNTESLLQFVPINLVNFNKELNSDIRLLILQCLTVAISVQFITQIQILNESTPLNKEAEQSRNNFEQWFWTFV